MRPIDADKYYAIKPCPVCGRAVDVFGTMFNTFFIMCDNENCGYSYGRNSALGLEETIRSWNGKVMKND